MKKRSVIVAMLCSMCLAVSTPIPAMACALIVFTTGGTKTDGFWYKINNKNG